MEKKDFLIIISGLVILTIIILASFLLPTKTEQSEVGEVSIITDTDHYDGGGLLKIKIDNNLEEKICFSSCYPYYFQKKDGLWIDYRYKECGQKDLIEYCVEAKEMKTFELTVPSIIDGIHRIALSACLNCQFNELFKEETKFYSNDFTIK